MRGDRGPHAEGQIGYPRAVIRWSRRLLSADEPGPGWGRGAWGLYVLFALTSLVTVMWGRMILDEGWYIYAGQLVARGRLPYRDFFFPQAPLAALAFAPVSPWGSHGLWAARAWCAVMGLVAVALTLRAAGRLAGRTASVWTAVLLMGSYAFVHGTSTARSYALVALLTAAAFERLASDRGQGREWLVGTALLSLAVAARPSMVPMLAVVAAVGLWKWRSRAVWWLAAAFLPGGLAALPFLWLGADGFWFGVVDFHDSYYGAAMHAHLLREFGLGLVGEQPAAVILGCLAVVLWGALARRTRPLTPALRLAGVALLSWIAVLALHATRSAPFAHHQTMFLPLLALGTGLTLSAWRPSARALMPAAVWALSAVGTSWGHWAWPPRWNGDGTPARAAEAAQVIEQAVAGGPLLSFDPTLAVLSGVPLLDGFEMGVFSYWPRHPHARALGGRNRDDLRDAVLAARAPVIALQLADLKLISQTGGQDILHALARNYRELGRVPRYGQWLQDLVVFRVRDDRVP